ncbi:carbonic anhydrase family protein (plasmid) [Nicoliella spurrieriana]|uniref:carbonic anhydrase n=1 Tax=Nicoliella spurrieriana TaxID=2925830 RepID=A0A976RQZ4_9LACO|nr:carbonic anhydrase family protein [Nicoliella spurrieriana]UQS86197.1 carbonic anhydrase family protein [Nicoliella spurrieriana]
MLNYHQQSEWTGDLGKLQSPINIVPNQFSNDPQRFNYDVQTDYILNQVIDDGTTIRLTGSGQANIFQRTFQFQQVHFHIPAEHLIAGARFPFEIHLVHQNAIGQKLVTALMATIGDANSQFEQILNSFAPKSINHVAIKITDWINFSAKHGFHYLGSLTTPPLTEGVEWLVLNNAPITISDEQLQRYRKLFKENARHLQPLNDRKGYSF